MAQVVDIPTLESARSGREVKHPFFQEETLLLFWSLRLSSEVRGEDRFSGTFVGEAKLPLFPLKSSS